MTQKQAGPARTSIDGVDLDRVVDWLSAQGLGDGVLTTASRVPGGTQNVLVRLHLGGTELMLRRPALHERPGGDETVLREARVLAALARSDVPHPRLLAVCDDPTVTGAAFLVMQSITGFNPTRELPGPFASHPPTQHYLGLAMVDGLAALGRVDLERTGLRDLSRPGDWIERQISRWPRLLDTYGKLHGYEAGRLDGADRVRDWIQLHAPAGWTPGLVHGDFHFANVLIQPHAPELAAILDWELASIGDPLLDLGHLLATWPGHEPDAITDLPRAPGLPSRAEMVARYAWASGRDLGDLTWFCVLACYRLAVLLEGTYARSRAGLASPAVGDSLGAMALRLVLRAERTMRDPAGMLE